MGKMLKASDMEPELPMEAKSHISFFENAAVSSEFNEARLALIMAKKSTNRMHITNLYNIIDNIWLDLSILMPDMSLDHIEIAWREFYYYYNVYMTHPEKRTSKLSNEELHSECLKRLKEIYRVIRETMQTRYKWFYRIERGKMDLSARLEAIQKGLYGKHRNFKRMDENAHKSEQ